MHIHKVVPPSNYTYNHHNPSKYKMSRSLAISIHMLLGWKSAFFPVKRRVFVAPYGALRLRSGMRLIPCGNQLNQHEIVDLPINSMVVFHSDMLVYQRVNLHFPVFLWFSHGFLVFLWFSHGFPMPMLSYDFGPNGGPGWVQDVFLIKATGAMKVKELKAAIAKERPEAGGSEDLWKMIYIYVTSMENHL